jgi:uncharacterized membrane protein
LDGLAVLAVLAVLWALIGPIVVLVVARAANRRAAEMAIRLAALEARLSAAPPETAPRSPWAEPVVELGPEAAPVEPLEPAPAPEPDLAEPETLAPEVPPPARPRESLESKIGARWSVLVGGLALALGAVFLVRYSIEQGLLGPAARIALGGLLSAGLFAAGEVLRRRDRAAGAPTVAAADVPAILTAAGGVAAFATIYAAYALYGYVGSATAFVLLTAAGLVTLLLSVIHGPALAGLGALGSYAAPLLVASAEPQALPVVLHTLAVTAAVLGMGRIRGWRWLAIAGIAASLGWGVLAGLAVDPHDTGAQLLLAAGLALTVLGTLVAGTQAGRLRDSPPDSVALAALVGIAVLSILYGRVNPTYPQLVSAVVLAGLFGAAASRWLQLAPAVLIAAALSAVTIMLLPIPISADLGWIRLGAFQWRIAGDAELGLFAWKAFALGLLMGVGGLASADRFAAIAPRSAGLFAAAGAGTPLVILAVVYLRHVPFETRPLIGLAALILAALLAAVTERLAQYRSHDPAAPAPALAAAGAVLALAFAVAVGLNTGFIPLALSLGAAGVAWVSLHRPVAALPWLAAVCAGLACLALLSHRPFTLTEIGATPILNGLILRTGLPAAAVLLAGELLRRAGRGTPAAILQAIGMALAALFVVLEIRHLANGGAIAAGPPGLGEQGALTLAALAFSLGLQRIARETRSAIYRAGSLAAGLAGAAAIAVAHFVTANPMLTGESVGSGFLINLLLPGYLLPALAAAWVAAAARGMRPRWYVLAMSGLSLALGFAYLTLMVRHAFHGPVLSEGGVGDAENWTYSAVWLVFGIALLAAGIALRSPLVRAASGIVIAAVVCKVFLLDMAALTGALRAASFLGLGATLIVIGRLYQRLLSRGRPAPE